MQKQYQSEAILPLLCERQASSMMRCTASLAETHNPIELHASVAVYDGDKFTLYETSQAVVNHRDVMAAMLGVPPDKVQVISRYLGSGLAASSGHGRTRLRRVRAEPEPPGEAGCKPRHDV